MANGWGQGAWDAVGWGGIGNTSFAVTGVAGTGEIGNEGVSATSVVVETGLQATGSIGTVSASSVHITIATSVVGTASVGNVLAKIPITFSVTGVSATSGFLSGWGSSAWGDHIWGGGVFADVGQTLAVSTNVAQGLVQTPTIIGACNFSVTGVAGTGAIGNEVVDAQMKFVATGLSATGAVGDEGVTGTSVVIETGLSASALISGYEASTVTKTITVQDVSGANKYFVDGVQQATLELFEGNTYRFDQSDSSNSGHPLRFSTTSNGTHGGGSEYTTGVTTNGTPGSAGAYTQIEVTSGTVIPTLYYYCTNHSGMGGQANTPIVYTISTTTGAPVTNVVGTTALGSESIIVDVNMAVTLAGLSISAGTLAISGGSVLSLTGLEATGGTGEEQVYGLITPTQLANYGLITTTQLANWIERAA
jgi:hypothetical protein